LTFKWFETDKLGPDPDKNALPEDEAGEVFRQIQLRVQLGNLYAERMNHDMAAYRVKTQLRT
jgi:hypothetical protein